MSASSLGAKSWGFYLLRNRAAVLVLVLVIVIDLSIICGTSPAMRLRTMIRCAGLKNARIVDYDYDYDYEHEHEHEHEGVARKLESR
ncbi:MAG: hypothetical protein FJY92_08545 [Candidatus Hydrogenedentes bacterium]|nr:hypothetical protein [Candidatus Hydrogenedentota bacterium]